MEYCETFTPDPELVSFADDFSTKYEKLSEGDYFSEKEKYQIKYLPGFECNGPNFLARINNTTGIIEINRFAFLNIKGFTTDFVFFIILWCVACRQCAGNVFKADEITFRYYHTTKRSVKNVLVGMINIFQMQPTKLNQDRCNTLTDMQKP
jgi:hypothetical protein